MAELIFQLMNNTILFSALFAWFLAQVLKTLFDFISSKEFSLERMFGSGGMPSSHTALVVGMTTAIAMREGADSTLFGIAFVFSSVVMYDAAGIRRAAGSHARVLNQIIKELKVNHTVHQITLKELLGHTPIEVLVGGLLGFTTAYVFCKMMFI